MKMATSELPDEDLAVLFELFQEEREASIIEEIRSVCGIDLPKHPAVAPVAEGLPEDSARYEQVTDMTPTTGTRFPVGRDEGSGDAPISDFLLGRAGTKERFETAKAFVGRAMARGDIMAEPGTARSPRMWDA